VKSCWRNWQHRILKKRLLTGTQITLSQRSIFVLPSRFSLFFTLVLVLVLLIAINYQNSLAYALTFLLFSLFCISLLHSFANLAGLAINAEASPAVFAGSQALFHLRLASHSRAHQAIVIGFGKDSQKMQDVPAGGSVSVQLEYPANARGWLKPGKLLIESHFPLGLWRVWSWVQLEQRILVYPRPLESSLALVGGEADSNSEQQTARVGTDDFQGHRRFAPGDSLKRLDWKAFSRERGLLLKEFASLQGSSCWLDFSALQGDSETRLSILAHQVLALCASGQVFGLRLPGQNIAQGSGDTQRDICLQALALYGITQ